MAKRGRPIQGNPEREQAVFNFVVAFKAANGGNSPTMREICEATGIPSTNMVALYLRRLEAQGRITLGAFQARNIVITGARWTPPRGGEL